MAAETNHRFQGRLRRPVDARGASVVLRRLHAAGRLRLVRPGRASQEALYEKPGRQPRPGRARRPEFEIAANPEHLVARIGFLAVLHTWNQQLAEHPHLHCTLPGGGLSVDRRR